jgi:hypothetical protein
MLESRPPKSPRRGAIGADRGVAIRRSFLDRGSGMALVNATSLIAELGDRSLALCQSAPTNGLLGLVASEHSSADSLQRRGHHKAGNSAERGEMDIAHARFLDRCRKVTP